MDIQNKKILCTNIGNADTRVKTKINIRNKLKYST